MSEHDREFPQHDPARFVTESWTPAYEPLWRQGLLEAKVEQARRLLRHCTACPRHCGVDRVAGILGACCTGQEAMVASASPHLGEEVCLVGQRGSGTIFFSRCNLSCVFCQNHDLSQQGGGQACSAEQIAELALELQARGCHNINFVTPEHVVPQVVEAIVRAVEKGLRVPVVYNTSAYDSVDSLRLLDGLVDIYMPDFKFWRNVTAARYCGAADYPLRARAAIAEMQRQVGPLMCDPDGVAVRGLLVRHLVMPGLSTETAAILQWLAAEISSDTFVNIMGQYRPAYLVGTRDETGEGRFPDLDRRPTADEMAAAFTAAETVGLWRLDDR